MPLVKVGHSAEDYAWVDELAIMYHYVSEDRERACIHMTELLSYDCRPHLTVYSGEMKTGNISDSWKLSTRKRRDELGGGKKKNERKHDM